MLLSCCLIYISIITETLLLFAVIVPMSRPRAVCVVSYFRVHTRPGEPGGMSLFEKSQGEPGGVMEKI